ncbi:unnamed protein product, partial [Staurois parvus]
LITSGFFIFFLNKPKTTENFEKKIFLSFCYKILYISDFSPSLMCANEAAVMGTYRLH